MDEPPEVRRCGRCKLVKPVTEFRPKKKGKWQGYCISCHADWRREYYLKHRDEYTARALQYKEKLKAVLRAAKNRPCADCGVLYPPYVMDFDHREGEQKRCRVAELNANRWVSIQQLEAEIAKCDLVCANCHRERTHQRRLRKAAAQSG
jgi:hypothetical protein